jgi:putative addiction module killer protein
MIEIVPIHVTIYTDAAGCAPFQAWYHTLADRRARVRISARIARMRSGNFGDWKVLRGGIMELRIDHGPGYRVYVGRVGQDVVILLCASDKAGQDSAIQAALSYWNEWQQHGEK